MFRKIITVMLCLFMVAGSVLPQNSEKVYALSTYETETAETTVESADYDSTDDVDLSQIDILGEVVSERTSTSKTFKKVDGTYEIAIYDDVIHYYENGEWIQVDNSLTDIGGELETKSNSFKLKFPKTIDDNKQIKLSYDDYKINWSILNINSSEIEYTNEESKSSNIKDLSNINGSVQYSNISNNVDVEYIVTGSKVKENIVLNEYVEDLSFSFSYELKGLSLIEDNDGNLVFVNDEGEDVFTFDELYMYDNEMNISYDLVYELVETGIKTYTIKIIPDEDWLQTAKYPVTIDPSLTSSNTSMSVQSTYVYQGAPTSNFAMSDYLIISGIDDVNWYQGLLKFSLPSTLQDVSVTYANLTLSKRVGTTGRTIALYQNTSYFNTIRVNWNTAPSYDTEIIDYHIVSGDDKYIFNITDSVKNWLSGTSNYGFTIKDTGIFNANNSVWSSTYGTTSLKPVIEIGYIDNTGLKDYWTYESQEVGEAGTGYISDYTGLLTFTRSDFSYSTERDLLDLTMIYNVNNSDSNIGYGLGWQTSYNRKIEYDTSLSTYYMTDYSGGQVYFYNVDEDITSTDTEYPTYLVGLISTEEHADMYISENGSGEIMMVLYDSSEDIQGIYVLDTDFTVNYFETTSNDIYYLSALKMNASSVNHSKITISRNATTLDMINGITINTDSVNNCGNFIQFNYTSGRLSSTVLYLYIDDSPTYSAIEKIEYGYTDVSGSGDYALTSVVKKSDLDGNSSWTTSSTISYTYDSEGKMLTAHESGQGKVAYTYLTGTNAMDSVNFYENNYLFATISYDYDTKKTTITDQDSNYIEFKFDDYGHTVNIIDSEGVVESYSYMNIFTEVDDTTTGVTTLLDGTPNYNNNNKLISSSQPQTTNQTNISNSGFEYSLTDSYDDWSNLTLESGESGTLTRASSSPDVLIGSYYAKITANVGNGAYITQSITLDAGTYTVSGFVYNSTSSLDNVFIDVIGESYGSSAAFGDELNNWQYVSQYFVIENDNTTISIKLGVYGQGYGCFDAIQITEGFGTETVNLMENSSFEYAYSSTSIPEWTNLSTGVSRVSSTFDNILYQDILGAYSIKIEGSATALRSIQNTNTSFVDYDASTEVVTIGGWAKSEGTPTTMQDTDTYERVFRIKVVEKSATGAVLGTHYIDFDTSIEGWQYKYEEITLDEDTTSIITTLEYQGLGSVYFDNVQLKCVAVYNHYNYDSAGRIINIIKPSDRVTYTYATDSADDAYTRIPNTITQGGICTEISSDAEVIQDITVNNVKVSLSDNDYGQNISVTYGNGITTYYSTSTTYLSSAYYQYLSSTTDEFGYTTDYYYDIYSGLLEAVGSANDQETEYIYDDIGNLTEVISSADNSSIVDGKVAYLYNSNNQLYKICIDYTNPSTPTYYYEITYDSQNRIETIKVNSSNLISYDYEDDTYYSENIDTETYGNSDSIKYEYNDNDQVTEVLFKLSGDSVYTTRYLYEYDTDGNMNIYTEVDSSSNVIDREFYVYDSNDRISKIIDIDDNVIEYQYDSLGNVESIRFVINGIANEITYDYDSESRISETTYESLETYIDNINRQYDYTDTSALERLKYITLLLDSTTTIYEKDYEYYYYTSRVTSITYDIVGQNSEDFGYSYEYDELGNITQVRIKIDSQTYQLCNYEYDGLNQLIVEDIYYVDSGIDDYTYVYEYDQQGNRISKSMYDYQRDGLDQAIYTLDYSYNSVWQDQLDYYDILVNGTVYTQDIVSYDGQGNPIEIENFVYTTISGTESIYDHAILTWEARTLTSITVYNASDVVQAEINYNYNADGYRTSKIITEGTNSRDYTYELLDSSVISETIVTTVNSVQTTQYIYYYYDADGTLIGFNLNDEDYFYINNIQGDITGIVDTEGNIIVKYDYDSYGNIINCETDSGFEYVSNANSYTYRGYRYDSETNFYYLNSRYYNPEAGRFISSDGLIGTDGQILSTNMYAYCVNDPVNNVDPTGYWRFPSFIFAVAFDAAIMSIASAFSITWLSYMAPLKFMARRTAASYFTAYIAPYLSKLSGVLAPVIIKGLTFIGRAALAATINMSLKAGIMSIVAAPMRAITACTSVGGLLAAIWDYASDKKFDGWIKI